MANLPLSKTLDPADFDALVDDLLIVDKHFTKDRAQHPMRRWEYAMALRAINTWWATKTINVSRVVDVGGAGSPFWRMIDVDNVFVLDPETNADLSYHITNNANLSPIVTCLSVLEHVDDLDRFLYHLSCLVAPGGLLFLTMDFAGDDPYHAWPQDTYHFHWMRKRIFNMVKLENVLAGFVDRDFFMLGGRDRIWHGPQVYDYTFASLALIKRP